MMSITKSEPLLQSGMKLDQEEFLRRWYAMPKIKNAELINGVVYMPSPLSRDHGVPDNTVSGWVAVYSWNTLETEAGTNLTYLFSSKNVPQPDQSLRILPAHGGRTKDEGNLNAGPPELAIEVSVSSLSFDLGDKLTMYELEKVQEYLIVDVKNQQIHWHQLVDNKYQRLESDDTGVLKSIVFPGLWLHGQALFDRDAVLLQNVLQQGLQSPEHADFVEQLEQVVQE